MMPDRGVEQGRRGVMGGVETYQPVGFQNLVMGLSWGYAACLYSLIKPPRTGRRVIRLSLRSETGWSGRGGRSR
jgi:hypothetical protein